MAGAKEVIPSAEEVAAANEQKAEASPRISFAKFVQLDGPAIDEYRKVYLEGHSRGVLQTIEEWRAFLTSGI